MVRLKHIFTCIAFLCLNITVFAQQQEDQDFFFRSGKYYVVAAVLVILFILLFIYLRRMDKRVKKLERRA
ncbi:MAG: CcmD family protein [Bacteroidetes bacterium]|jgi:hypothetical protein|nr:CcmD family protein [Bacteroidota bacterium]